MRTTTPGINAGGRMPAMRIRKSLIFRPSGGRGCGFRETKHGLLMKN
jgi:hypothetical protein